MLQVELCNPVYGVMIFMRDLPFTERDMRGVEDGN